MQARDRALSRVPVEVWHDIFEFVTSVPRKYEFTLDSTAYVMANEASRAEAGIPTSKEAAEITKSRFSIICVCRHWYAIGIKALWSHLRINLRAKPIRVIEGIYEAISRDTTIGSYVIRITLEFPGSTPLVAPEVIEEPLRRLTSQLPSLAIFVCPGRYACGIAKSSLDIVVWKGFTTPKIFRKQTKYIQNVRVLSIGFRLDHQLHSDCNPVLFPRLESLNLWALFPQILDFTRNWEMPNLHILSIWGTYMTNLVDFIEKWSTNIDLLELSSAALEWPRWIHLPNLKELRIDQSLLLSYQIAAPKLERFCLLSFDAHNPPARDNIISAIDRARTYFPALITLQFRGLQGDSRGREPVHYGLTVLDIHNWTQAGLKVDISLFQPI